MEDGEQLARRGDATIGRASQEQTELRPEPVARDETAEAGVRDTTTVERRHPRSCHGKNASSSPPSSSSSDANERSYRSGPHNVLHVITNAQGKCLT
ncbi:kazrin-A isoform X1 [Tachysurus ichikawai]